MPQLCASARRLERAGAQVLVMSCNTVHYFYDAVASSVSVPLLHMPRLTTAFVEQSGLRRVALLATDGHDPFRRVSESICRDCAAAA